MYYISATYDGYIDTVFKSDNVDFRTALAIMVEMFETKLADNKHGLLVIEMIEIKNNRIVGRMLV